MGWSYSIYFFLVSLNLRLALRLQQLQDSFCDSRIIHESEGDVNRLVSGGLLFKILSGVVGFGQLFLDVDHGLFQIVELEDVLARLSEGDFWGVRHSE